MYCTTNPGLIDEECTTARRIIMRLASLERPLSQAETDARSAAFATLRAYEPTERDDSGE